MVEVDNVVHEQFTVTEEVKVAFGGGGTASFIKGFLSNCFCNLFLFFAHFRKPKVFKKGPLTPMPVMFVLYRL